MDGRYRVSGRNVYGAAVEVIGDEWHLLARISPIYGAVELHFVMKPAILDPGVNVLKVRTLDGCDKRVLLVRADV